MNAETTKTSKQAQTTADALRKLQAASLGRLRVEDRRSTHALCVSEMQALVALGYATTRTEETQDRSGKHMGRRTWTVYITLTEAGKTATL